MSKLTFTDSWEDDHCPCVSFTYKEKEFEIWWTSNKVTGQIEMISDGEYSFETFVGDKPQFAEIIENPAAYFQKYQNSVDAKAEDLAESSFEDNEYNFYCEVCVLTYKPK